jgi:hypothetical protein
MDWFNPVEWFAWLYGKVFQNHFYIGAAVVMVVFAVLGLVLWIRGVDHYKEAHPSTTEASTQPPKQQTVAANNTASQSAAVETKSLGDAPKLAKQSKITKTSPTSNQKHKTVASLPFPPPIAAEQSTETSAQTANDSSIPGEHSSSISGVTIDCSGISGVVGMGCVTKDCEANHVKVKNCGNGGVGVWSRGDLKARNLTVNSGESPENQSIEHVQLVDSSDAKTSNHRLEINRHSAGLSQQQALDVVIAAVKRFATANHRMPNNQELATELGDQAANVWVNVDCGGHGVGIANTGSSSFEDVTINQTSCDTGIDNSADGATFKGIRITINPN